MSLTHSKILTFLICGGLAALANWLARIVLSAWLPFSVAVIVAYVFGMCIGFALYKNFVWAESKTTLSKQLGGFVVVNAASACIVLVSAIAVLKLFALVMTDLPLAEALAHGFAIAVGAVANYLGHNAVTFRSSAK